MNKEMKRMLEVLAKRKCWCDSEDFIPDDYAAGNIDDAYEGGFNDGQASLAKILLKEFFGEI